MKIKIFIIFFILPIVLLSQEEWKPKGKIYDTTFVVSINPLIAKLKLKYQEYQEPYEKNSPYSYTVFRLDVIDTKTNKTIQYIVDESTAYKGPLNYDYGALQLKQGILMDINFDGYQDLRFKTIEGANTYLVNQSYNFYLYNPEKKIFEFCEDLRDFENPLPLPKDKIILTYWRNGLSRTAGSVREYKWDKDKIVLLLQYDYQLIEEGNEENNPKPIMFKRWKSIYKNKKIELIDSVFINEKDIPKLHRNYW